MVAGKLCGAGGSFSLAAVEEKENTNIKKSGSALGLSGKWSVEKELLEGPRFERGLVHFVGTGHFAEVGFGFFSRS